MSFVTTPMRSSSPSERQSAATSELLPEPTGPPMPIRKARSAGKEPPLPGGVGERAQLEGGREPGRQSARVVGHRTCGEVGDQRRRRDEPARSVGGVDRQQLHGGGGDGRRVLVEIGLRDLVAMEAGGGGDDAERDRARGGRA